VPTPAAIPEPWIDRLKAGGALAILAHHLAFYDPLTDALLPYARGLIDVLFHQARWAVQIFLVVSGFLAARSLTSPASLQALRGEHAGSSAVAWMVSRYQRLMPAFLVAVGAAVLAAWLARQVGMAGAPAAPSWHQLLAHALLLQDVLGLGGLSAGAWYVAIDLQLYSLAVVVVWIAQGAAAADGPQRRIQAWLMALLALLLALTLASLLHFNRIRSWDAWALYFMGAYGLGALAHGVTRTQRRWSGWLLLLTITAVALAVQWRSRIAVAGVVALLLAACAGRPGARPASAAVRWLSRVSYELFLVHYPVLLLVAASIHAVGPSHPVRADVVGLVFTVLLSLLAAQALHQGIEAARAALRRRAKLAMGSVASVR
jgi:peptidoglycan/LPS O-acetylase OafA/YrhL